eukprot:7260345-Prymnesium_polylepis.1
MSAGICLLSCSHGFLVFVRSAGHGPMRWTQCPAGGAESVCVPYRWGGVGASKCSHRCPTYRPFPVQVYFLMRPVGETAPNPARIFTLIRK